MSLYSDQWATVYHADAAKVGEILPEKSVHTCVTSPPYFGLRSYLAAEDEHKAHELGAEESPEEYVAALVEVFRGVWQVLRDDGTAWLNLGDSFAAGGTGGYSARSTLSGFTSPNTKGRQMTEAPTNRKASKGRKPKDLVGIPWLVAFALQQDGWYLRSDIIWAKDSCMPESVRDRPTKAHEYVFLLAKQPRYFYDADAIREPYSESSAERYKYAFGGEGYQSPTANPAAKPNGKIEQNPGGKNKRSVWRVNPKPYSGAHFAVFPPALIEPCIKAGTSEKGVCSECGAPWERVVEQGVLQGQGANPGQPAHLTPQGYARNGKSRAGVNEYSRTTGFQPTCSHNADAIPATVLDPFAGSGTTMHTARKLGRRSVGLELDSRCGELIQERMGYQEVLL